MLRYMYSAHFFSIRYIHINLQITSESRIILLINHHIACFLYVGGISLPLSPLPMCTLSLLSFFLNHQLSEISFLKTNFNQSTD